MLDHHLVISALGPARPELIFEISKICVNCGCTILDSRITTFNDQLAIILNLAGNWGGIAKLEAAIPTLKTKLGLSTLVSRSTESSKTTPMIPYSVQVIAIDRPGILLEISEFFLQRNIRLVDIRTEVSSASRTNTPIFSLEMLIHIPNGVHISGLREQFMMYCDDRNLDAILEPQKN